MHFLVSHSEVLRSSDFATSLFILKDDFDHTTVSFNLWLRQILSTFLELEFTIGHDINSCRVLTLHTDHLITDTVNFLNSIDSLLNLSFGHHFKERNISEEFYLFFHLFLVDLSQN